MQMLKPWQASLEHEKKMLKWTGAVREERDLSREQGIKHALQNDVLVIHYSLGPCSPSKQLKVNKGHKQKKVIIGCEI